MGEEIDENATDKKKAHRERKAGRKAEKKKAKKQHVQELTDRQRNPKAFTFNSAVQAERRFRRKQDLQTKKQHIPVVDRNPLEPPPLVVAVVGPPKVGKTTLIQNLIKHFTNQNLAAIKGPVTIVIGKKKRITLMECNNDINSMIDLSKVADLVLLLVDASFGFEMEIFEFLNMCQVHGMPKIIGVLTHLDLLKNNKQLKKTKRALKHRFWYEVYPGAKLFYISGIINEVYIKNDIKNLGRFILITKLRPLVWRSTHPYILVDRVEDITEPEAIRQNYKCDRHICLYGFVRGVALNKENSIHIPGYGDHKITTVNFLPDPCPLPEQKKRSLLQREKSIYAPFSGVGGVVYDKDGVYIELSNNQNIPETITEKTELVNSILTAQDGIDIKRDRSELKIFSHSKPIVSNEFRDQADFTPKNLLLENEKESDGDESVDEEEEEEEEGKEDENEKNYFEEKVEQDGRVRRRVVFKNEINETAVKERGEESSEESDDEDYEDESERLQNGKEESEDEDEEDEEGFEDEEESEGEESDEEEEKKPKTVSVKKNKEENTIKSKIENALRKVESKDTGFSEMEDESEVDEEELEEEEEDDGEVGGRKRKLSGGEENEKSNKKAKEGDDFDFESSAVRWKENLAQRASDAFLERQNNTQNLYKLVYGNRKKIADGEEGMRQEEEEEEIGGIFHLVSEKQREKMAEKDQLDETDTSIFPLPLIRDWTSPDMKVLIKDCFVTGKWKSTEDAEELLKLDNMSDEDDEDLEKNKEDDSESAKELEKKKELLEKKKKLKEMFNAEYDEMEEYSFYNDLKAQVDHQAKLNKFEFEGLADDVRVELEGFRPGMYVRVELSNMFYEIMEHFDPSYPLIIGGLLPIEENVGYVQVRMKKHRWYSKILKTKDPLIVSLGWRRFQTLPVYSKLEDNLRQRMLKYTPEHVSCMGHFWGPITPQGTGFLGVQSVATRTPGFRIACTGAVVEVDKSTVITKKLKLVGTPSKIFKKTAFIEGMFNSVLEVGKFEGAKIRTVSGIRGQIKKALPKPKGAFRATFEDKIKLSDIVFCRTWCAVDVPRFYNPVTTLLLPPEKKTVWEGMRTVGQLKRERNIKNKAELDSLYTPIKRNPKRFKPFKIPKSLQKALPYKDKPKEPKKKKKGPKRVAVVMEPHERKVSEFMNMVKTNYQQKVRTEKLAMVERVRKHRKEKREAELKKLKRQKELKKRVYMTLSKIEKNKRK